MIIIDNCQIATVDSTDRQLNGHLVVDGNRITVVAAGPAPESLRAGAELVDGTGCLATPGLVNTHHHLYQWLTRGFATQDSLFDWLLTLYRRWTRLRPDEVHAAAAANLGWLALSGCSTTTDHHYVFPRGGGDLLEAEIIAATEIGLRFHPCRGSMDLGESAGGLPPDEVVEDRDEILAATEAAITRWHDPSPDAMTRIAVAPCSPFSVTAELMRESADLARNAGVRLHTHLAETLDEAEFCQATYGKTPTEYLDELDWLGDDVWLAHAIHLSDSAVARLAGTGTGIAHCPTSNGRLGAGTARVRELLDAGVPIGLGVDGAASNEAGRLIDELRAAMVVARLRGGPQSLSGAEALRMATMGGARCLGRQADIGSLEVGKLADIALWRVDRLGQAGGVDPLWSMAFGSSAPLDLLLVDGQAVVADGRLVTADEDALARNAVAASLKVVAQ